MSKTAKHRAETPSVIANLAKSVSTPTARRGIVAAASSGLVVTMAATTAMAAPDTSEAAAEKVSGSRMSAPSFARAATPTITVPADVEWTTDDILDGVATDRPATAPVVEAQVTSSRDTVRAEPPAPTNVQSLSDQGYTTRALNVRSGPGTDYRRIGAVRGYRNFQVTGKANGWYRIAYNGGEGWVSGHYTRLGAVPERPAPAPAPAPEAAAEQTMAAPSGGSTELGNQIVAIARQYIGTPYVWGGRSPGGFDCSGFTSYVYAQVGISIPTSSSGQGKIGRRIPASEAMPGDLIWVPGHVGIYTGGWNHIAARNPSRPLQEGTIYMKNPVFIRVY